MDYSQIKNATDYVEGVDKSFIIILGISFLFLISLTVLMIYFVIRYNKKRNPKATQIEGSTKLEILWTVIPTILVLIMFYYGWIGWRPQQKAPDDAMVVKAIARMWSFSFEYENGKITDSLYVPLNKPVKLDLVALDVIHSLYIPAFRLKKDMVPGNDQFMWFTARKPGTYDLFCAEYCGLQHSYMYSGVKALPEEDFTKWYQDTTLVAATTEGDTKIGLAGMQVMRNNGCIACHSSDGSKLVGPSYKGLFGKPRVVTGNGEEKEVIADAEYIKRAIYDPNVEIVKGYQKGLMLSYKDLISEEDLEEIIKYLESIK